MQNLTLAHGQIGYAVIWCEWWWSVALQPRPGLGLPYGFHESNSTMWGYQLHNRPILNTLIQSSETSSSNNQRLSWRSRETRVRNGRWILSTSTYRARTVLLHAVNLRHGTDGFTSPPKEGVLRILSLLKSIVLCRVWTREYSNIFIIKQSRIRAVSWTFPSHGLHDTE
jgi:hypothetical protein